MDASGGVDEEEGIRVEVGGDIVAVRARVAEGEERDRLFDRQKAAYPGFADYEAGTDRVIPVVVLERA